MCNEEQHQPQKISKLLLWFVLVISCFNSSKIQWSPLKILRVGESLFNGQARDFFRFFRGWFLETSWKVQSNIQLCKVNNGDTRIMYQICSKLTLKKLGWRYWPLSAVFTVISFEHITYIVLAFPLLALIFVSRVKWLSYGLCYN